MRISKYHILSLFCFILGVVFFALGFLQGDVEGGVFIVFPFLAGSGIYAFLGVILIFIAILLFMFGFTSKIETDKLSYDYEEQPPQKKTSVKGGGVVLIGPIPIVFGSNWKIAAILMIIAIILIVLVSFFMLRLY